jgi:hypothetical protein
MTWDLSEKDELHFYLTRARDALVWKLDGLSEYDARRPLVRTGTNLLGLVKHVAGVTADYFGVRFGRPFDEPMPWNSEDAEVSADMWAIADETREHIVGLYHRAWAHADATIEALDLSTTGHVPWWPPERREPPLRLVMIHMIAEVERHAGHADIVRELIDGSIGIRPGQSNLPSVDQAWWETHRDRVEQAAKEAGA